VNQTVLAAPCHQCKRLQQRYRDEFEAFVKIARCLDRFEGHAFATACRIIEQARLAFDQARRDLNRHLSTHRCFDEIPRKPMEAAGDDTSLSRTAAAG
jgi:hypothetical protein